jgi:hypothetical protein
VVLNLKFLNELATSNDRNFKFTALSPCILPAVVAAPLRPYSTAEAMPITEGNATYRHPFDVSPNSRAEHVIRFVDFFIRICHVSSHWKGWEGECCRGLFCSSIFRLPGSTAVMMLKNESRGNETLRMKVAQQCNPTASYHPCQYGRQGSFLLSRLIRGLGATK